MLYMHLIKKLQSKDVIKPIALTVSLLFCCFCFLADDISIFQLDISFVSDILPMSFHDLHEVECFFCSIQLSGSHITFCCPDYTIWNLHLSSMFNETCHANLYLGFIKLMHIGLKAQLSMNNIAYNIFQD
ncbi:hypothetical protein ACJX0J_011881, partial [Zea mays]